MIRTTATAAFVTLASLSLVGTASAAGMAERGADAMGQFYATPIQKGAPTDLPGERLIPGASLAAQAIDVVVSPTLEPISQIGTTVGGTVGRVVDPEGMKTAAAGPAPMKARMHHRHTMMHHHMMMHHSMMMHHHHMMKKKMMMKKM